MYIKKLQLQHMSKVTTTCGDLYAYCFLDVWCDIAKSCLSSF